MKEHQLLEDLHSKERSVVALALVIGLVFLVTLAVVLAVSGMPAPVHQAWASLPTSPSPKPAAGLALR